MFVKKLKKKFFSRNVSKPFHPDAQFNNNLVKPTSVHKHLGMILDSNLHFEEQLKSVLKETNKVTGLIHEFRLLLSRNCLLTL